MKEKAEREAIKIVVLPKHTHFCVRALCKKP